MPRGYLRGWRCLSRCCFRDWVSRSYLQDDTVFSGVIFGIWTAVLGVISEVETETPGVISGVEVKISAGIRVWAGCLGVISEMVILNIPGLSLRLNWAVFQGYFWKTILPSCNVSNRYAEKNLSVYSECNQLFALSRRVNGNKQSLTASSDTPLYLKVSHISKKLIKCSFGSLFAGPPNWTNFWII